MRKLRLPLLLAAGLGLVLGCGGGSSSGSGSMNVHLVDGPINGFLEVNLNVQSVEIAGPSGWVTLATPNRTLNLLALTGGVSETLAAGASLPAGHYGQMRLVLGSGNTVKLADGSVHALFVPSGVQSGVKLVVSFDVAEGTTKDVYIDFDAAHSIQLNHTGASDKYVLRPTVRAFDKLVTGSVSGTLTAGGQPLAGAVVYAESLDSGGRPAIVRSAVTSASGTYTLDLLPTGGTYYVVSQPVVGGVSYDAKASQGFALSAGTPTFTYDAAFTADALTGSVSGGVTPVALDTQSDAVDLMQSLSAGGGASATFTVRSAQAAVGTSTETYAFAGVPAGTYAVAGTRTTLAGDGTATTSTSSTGSAAVTASATVTVDLAF